VAQVKMTKQLLFIIVGFLFAWTPYAIMSVLIMFFDAQIPLGTREYPAMFAKTAVIYRVYKKKLNRFEIALNFAKQPLVSSF
jgi:hypothetical protein